MNLPNKLTVGRILCVPVFMVLYMLGYYVPALFVFIAASLTDMLDGKIARKYNLVTNFGKIMDPLADKILVYSAFCMMVEQGIIPSWVLVIILAREFLMAGIRTVAASEGKVIAADMSGKIKTVLQMIAVPFLIVMSAVEGHGDSFETALRYAAYGFLYASLVMTVYSAVEYVVKNKEVLKQ